MAKLNGSIEVGQTWMYFSAQLASNFAYTRIFWWSIEDEWGNRIDEGEWQTDPYESSFELYYDDLDPGSSYYLAIDVYNDQGNQISYYYEWFTTAAIEYATRAYKGTGISSVYPSSTTYIEEGDYGYFSASVSTGYEFDGWYDYYTGYYVSGSNPYEPRIWEKTYLTAEATALTYTVKYNANGGSGAPSNQTKYYGSTLTLSSTQPTRTGYTFSYWNTASNGNGTTYYPGGSYTANAAITLYAIWAPITYTISYNANGGSGAPSSQVKTYGVNLTLSSTRPTRTGYTFLGWSESSTATTSTYAPSSTFTANKSVTLYAVWKVSSYTISYNANGGSGAPASQTKQDGVALNLSTTIPTKLGYTFLGWSIDKSATTATYAPGASFTVNAATTLYAVWKQNDLRIFYGLNGNWIEVSDTFYGQSNSWKNMAFGYGTTKGWKLNK